MDREVEIPDAPATVSFIPSGDGQTGTLSITTNEDGLLLVIKALVEGGILTMDDVERLASEVLPS